MFAIKEALDEIAHGDGAARDFLESFFFFCHGLDDRVDQDRQGWVEGQVWSQTRLIFTLAGNSFFAAHKDFLLPIIFTSALAFLASEERKNNSEVLERITAQVLKSEYQNVIFSVAYLVGGFDFSLSMSKKYRRYCFDSEPAKPAA